jgi:ribosome-associated toxin RatA of RatAB toxin-antitoxin module
MNIQQSIQISCPSQKAFQLATQVERFPEFAKNYLASEIISQSQDRNKLIVRRKVKVENQILAWKSQMEKKSTNHILYTQLEGPLVGMHADWYFSSDEIAKTKLTIIHTLDTSPHANQKNIEETVSKMTEQFLKDIRRWMESQ